MLRQVMKRFDADNNIALKIGDIVDVSGWKHWPKLQQQGYIAETDAVKPTVDLNAKKMSTMAPKKEETSAPKLPAKLRRSALASRPRVFRKA